MVVEPDAEAVDAEVKDHQSHEGGGDPRRRQPSRCRFHRRGSDGTDDPRVLADRLLRVLAGLTTEAAIHRDPEVIEALHKLSIEPVGNSPEEVAQIIRKEVPIYQAAADAAGLRRK